MKYIRKFNELNVSGTYLDKTNIPKTDTYNTGVKKEPSDYLKKHGKIFKDAPTTISKQELNFRFISQGAGHRRSFVVKFPDNFLNMDKDTDEYSFEPGQVPMPLKELLDEYIYIVAEGKFNRIHFTTFPFDDKLITSDGIPHFLRGTGLGYFIYENFIKFLGFASSNDNHTSPESLSIWNKIAKDPDFYGLIIKEEGNRGRILVFHKDAKRDVEKIATKFIVNSVNPNCQEIIVDDELMKLPAVADLKKKFDSLPKYDDGSVKQYVNGVSYEPFFQ